MQIYNSDIVIFGGHGDLSFRKLIPALYNLVNDNYLNSNSKIILITRKKITTHENTFLVKEKLKEFLDSENEFDENKFDRFKKHIYCCSIDVNDLKNFKCLEKILNEDKSKDRVFYFSTSSNLYETISKTLHDYDLITEKSRVVLEKPIGKDLKSSKMINDKVLNYFKEEQIYRIDHYLGKDTVQNLLALRFSNKIFFPLWDANNIDHVQITLSESVGVDNRWDFYNEYGAMRDMVQNHLLQLICLIAMEAPYSIDPNAIRDEKLKVLNSLRPIDSKNIKTDTVRAQYIKGVVNGENVQGYLDNKDIDSNTETFVALKIFIDNFRWSDTPFYIRTGKRMVNKSSEIVIQFKSNPFSIFDNYILPNKLVISLQPNESITLNLMNKVPGLEENMKLQEVKLELNASNKKARKYEAYERLLLDVIRCNPMLFMRLDEVEASWKWTDKIINAWNDNLIQMESYKAGTYGPNSSISMLAKNGRTWHE